MATTWGELRGHIIDLGFEEDDISLEYHRIMINATNHALQIITSIVVPQIEGYFQTNKSWGYEEVDDNGRVKWKLPKPKRITADTEDDQKINLPDNLMPLVPLLASHYIWLDDDITKATMYWNEYDQLKDQIIAVCRSGKGAVIEGGWGL